jgi:predicted RNase H-like HicB family nuclease
MRDNIHAMHKVTMIARWTPEGWWARGVEESIYTQGETLDELWANIQEAVAVHYEHQPVAIQVVIESHVPQAASTTR